MIIIIIIYTCIKILLILHTLLYTDLSVDKEDLNESVYILAKHFSYISNPAIVVGVSEASSYT